MSKKVIISKQDFEEWKSHLVTQEVYRTLEKIKTAIDSELASGAHYLGPSDREALQKICMLMGTKQGIDMVLNVQVEDVENESDSDRS